MKQSSLIVSIHAFAIVLCLQGVEAFTVISNAGKPSYWANGEVTYFFHTSVDNSIKNQFRQAFTSWESVPGVSLDIQESGTFSGDPNSDDGLNAIVWVTTAWRELNFRPPSNALAVTLLSFNASDGTIYDADIFFNAETFSWGNAEISGQESSVDIQNIATHEIGHLLGLDHSSEEYFETDESLADATMYYASSAGETTRRDLKDDDRYGLRALYGSTTPAAPVVTAVNEISRDDDIVDFQISGSNFSELTSFVITKGNSLSLDRVARYRTIVSSSEARITVDLSGFPNGGANLIAFNHPSSLATQEVTVTTSSISATSGGGGGCSLQAQQGHPFSWVTFYFSLLSALSLLLARRRYRQHRTHAQPEEGL